MMLAFVNMQVYKIYRFHLNGFILNMLTGPNAGDIFDFSPWLYLTEGLLLLLIAAVAVGLWWAAVRLAPRVERRTVTGGICLLLALLVVANGIHAYGAFVVKPSVLKSARLVPYYFPLSASSLMKSLGFEREVLDIDDRDGGELCYPLHPLVVDTAQAPRPNVVLVLIDSWSRRALTEETMPRLRQLAGEVEWYQNHVSCGNGTSFSVFGLFTGLQPYYWTAFEASRQSPLLVDQLLQEGYDILVYPSAGLQSPPFDRMLFQHVKNLRTESPGASSYERDLSIKRDLIADLPRLKAQGRPFFAFIFFDLLHAYSLPKELLRRFQPSWEYGRFDELHNDMDPTPFWNLYRNSAYQTDGMVGELVGALKEQGLYDETLLLITGDHAQEYNENKKNYWGHNSNFSQYQIGVPLLVHRPGQDSAAVFTHRTTHYDIVPTLMHDYLGVQNPLEDYTAGHLLSDPQPRLWHFVGNELRYAFLVEGDTILTKEGAGYVEVTDAHLNPVTDYRIRPHEFGEAIKRLNKYFK
jgi:membrane-anchored protein YejM (alkaline phosphatase superfamily)